MPYIWCSTSAHAAPMPNSSRLAVGIAGDQAPQAHALRCHRNGRLERPALEYRPIRPTRTNRGEMVENPHVVEPRLVGGPPDRAQVARSGGLAAVLESEAQGVRHNCLLYGSGMKAAVRFSRRKHAAYGTEPHADIDPIS